MPSRVCSLHAARHGAPVYAFEPKPACFRRLRVNVGLNGFAEQVTVFNAALSDAAGRGRRTTGGAVSLGDHGVVEVMTLDEALAPASIEQIDLLKIDIEGAEVGALLGASETLAKTGRVLAEYHSRELLNRASTSSASAAS